MVVGGAVQQNKLAPVAMGVGMALSVALIGMLLGALGPTLNARLTEWMLPIAS